MIWKRNARDGLTFRQQALPQRGQLGALLGVQALGQQHVVGQVAVGEDARDDQRLQTLMQEEDMVGLAVGIVEHGLASYRMPDGRLTGVDHELVELAARPMLGAGVQNAAVRARGRSSPRP